MEENKFWHRKQCSYRVFIGPWDIKAPPPPPEHFVANDSISIHSNESVSSLKLLKSNSSAKSSINRKDSMATSDETSFVTARSGTTNSTTYNSMGSTPQFLEQIANQDDDDDEIDYQFLTNANTTGSEFISASPEESEGSIDNHNDTESIETIKPAKGKLPMANKAVTTTALSTTNINTSTKKRKKRLHKHKKPLLWKKTGSVFVSRLPNEVTPDEPVSISTGKPLKREPILCMRSVGDCISSEPSRYKAAKEARFDLLTESWKQVELVLTDTHLSTYVYSSIFWPKQKLEHRVYLQGPKRQKNLELYLLSSLDYSFCLRHLSTAHGRIPVMVTMTFKARSFIKCQEWYMQLYDILPAECKRICPKWCEVYIPMLDISVNLPLSHIKHSYDVTMEDVKEAALTVLEEDALNEKMEKLAETDNLGLCWATKDRAEWIYWVHSSSDPTKRIDWALCPQNIEETHRLELRPIQHTPHDIILKESFTLKEPPPVEGFLIFATDLLGRTSKAYNSKMNYFASFDQFLFYTNSTKVSEPDIACVLDEDMMPKNIRPKPFVSAISPYAESSNEQTRLDEIIRRMKLMTEAKGMIDLTEVSYVRRTFTNEFDNEQDNNNPSQISFGSVSPMLPVSGQRQSSSSFFGLMPRRNTPCLELAHSGETCDLWVNYLAQIIVYYKARKEADKDVHTRDTSVYNSAIKVSENTLITDNNQIDTQDGCIHKKEESMVDTRIWSYCLYEQCRDIVKSGILYYKPPNRGSYSQKMFILTANGWILFYDVIDRSTKKKTSNHTQKGTIDIAGCYFYSGVDSSKMKKGSNQDNLWKKSTRIYASGLTTDDDTVSCVFSVWKPKLRRYFSPKRQRLRVYRQDQRLNSTGTIWTFLARSRREKEEWVCALNTVTEHMIRCENR
ncbi:hypothetical protein INT48_002070 [Thamnidium elegans]|uniref:PH domain-containing protein n=1 Tax=Thamnidium elegans TaxID=101142 RepID=A0A8H7SIL2_9FUNG|nr:hypothetical protein INT48_002070 [Thamnidium elegans]